MDLPRTVSASLLELAYICPTAAAQQLRPVDKAHPDREETQDSFQGSLFEQALEAMPEYWLPAAAKAAPQINWPKRLDRNNRNKPLAETDQGKITETENWLRSNQPGVPRIIYQGMLQGRFNNEPAIGYPDILLWTGAEYCIIDLKHTRQTKTEHAIQVTYYMGLLEQTLKHLEATGLPSERTRIASTGLLVYCKPSALFRRRQGLASIREADILAEALAYDLIQPELVKAYKMLTQAAESGTTLCANPEFKPACNRCSYRHQCFDGVSIQNKRADRLPLPAAAIEQLRASGLVTLAATRRLLTTQQPADVYNLLTRGNPDIANYLLRKCDEVEATGHCFEWQFPTNWTTDYCIYARDFSIPLAAKRQPCSHNCRIVAGGQPCSEFITWAKRPSVIVAFTHEEVHDFRSLLRSDSTLRTKLAGIPFVTLKEEIQRAYRGPVIAETIAGYNQLFAQGMAHATQQYAAWAQHQKEWHTPPEDAENRPRELAYARARELEKLWLLLTNASAPVELNSTNPQELVLEHA